MTNSLDTNVTLKDCAFTIKATDEQVNDGIEVKNLESGEREYRPENSFSSYSPKEIINLRFKIAAYEKEIEGLLAAQKRLGTIELNKFNDIYYLLDLIDDYLPSDLKPEISNIKIVNREKDAFYLLAKTALEKEKLLINNL